MTEFMRKFHYYQFKIFLLSDVILRPVVYMFLSSVLPSFLPPSLASILACLFLSSSCPPHSSSLLFFSLSPPCAAFRCRRMFQSPSLCFSDPNKFINTNFSEPLVFILQTVPNESPQRPNAARSPLLPCDLHRRLSLLSHDS
ncbi:hypothetical protein CHARACLAT_005061 [Characodon lateralis]|uniref:Transmembrane protein n=1 Tax=Characodon lateralis TaxID=208331 RepID=A0ABU7D8G5_9TELE|nr:hypothetical protein [Characodon lateralis]